MDNTEPVVASEKVEATTEVAFKPTTPKASAPSPKKSRKQKQEGPAPVVDERAKKVTTHSRGIVVIDY